jgi:hypothetical protein
MAICSTTVGVVTTRSAISRPSTYEQRHAVDPGLLPRAHVLGPKGGSPSLLRGYDWIVGMSLPSNRFFVLLIISGNALRPPAPRAYFSNCPWRFNSEALLLAQASRSSRSSIRLASSGRALSGGTVKPGPISAVGILGAFYPPVQSLLISHTTFDELFFQ